MNLSVLAPGSGWSRALLAGLGVTLGLAALAIGFGTLMGLGGALVLRGRSRTAVAIVAGLGALLRSLPELLVIFTVYYGLAFALKLALAPFGFTGFVAVDAFTTGVLAIGLIHGAYAIEVIRGALAAVPAGPLEAAMALGLSPWRRFRLVELPLATRYALPGLVNLSVMALKTTPFVCAIGLQDLLRTATDAGKNTKDYVPCYVAALVLYLLVAPCLYGLQLRLERRLEQGL